MASDTCGTRNIGIDQGNNYSPTALNLLLHYVHDIPLNAVLSHPFWFRYADNLLYLAENVSEGEQIAHQVESLLNTAGLKLKGKDGGVIDLSQNNLRLLGFDLRLIDDEIHFSIPESAWEELGSRLLKAHESFNPPETAVYVVSGWVNAFAPALCDEKSFCNRVKKLMAQYGFVMSSEMPSRVSKIRKRWCDLHQSANPL